MQGNWGKSPFDQEDFDVVTRMPPLGKPPVHPNSSTAPQEPQLPHKNYDPLNWNLFFDELFYLSDGTSVFRAGQEGAVFFCIHGAGHSALSFATLAKEVKHFGTVIAFDFKGHGYSKKDKNLDDLSIETLCAQTIETLKEIMQKYSQQNFVLVGHSLGGSVCIRIAETLANVEKIERIVGCVVIDVVEGTAIEALPFMNKIISDRPKHFPNPQAAVKWAYNSTVVRKLESAKVSVPAQLVQYEKKGETRYGWKVSLKETQKFWLGWFKGLSSIFLNIQIPKILLTAEKERLDKELTIAQMQGKFKLVVLHGVGHSVQEDDPKATAHELYGFLRNFRIPMTLSERAEKQMVGIANFHPHLAKY